MTAQFDIRGGDFGNYTLSTAGTYNTRGFVRRNATGGGYTVTLDGREWQMRQMPKVDKWEDLGDAVAATAQ